MEPERHEIQNPDPSSLTTSQLLREINSLDKLLESRLDAIEKAVKVAHENYVRWPTEVDKAINNLRALFDERFQTTGEKFNSIQTQFLERDTRTEQTSRDSKVAVDAALSAAKEAVSEQNKSGALAIAKSEAATTKQIDQIGVTISTIQANLSGKIDDVKLQLAAVVNQAKGSNISVDNVRGNTAVAVSLVVAVFSIGGLLWSAAKSNNPQVETVAPQIVYVPQLPPPATPPAPAGATR